MELEIITYGKGGFDAKKPDGNVLERRLEETQEPDPSDADRLRARIAELESVLVAKGLIDKTEADAVAAVEVTPDVVVKPGEGKDDKGAVVGVVITKDGG